MKPRFLSPLWHFALACFFFSCNDNSSTDNPANPDSSNTQQTTPPPPTSTVVTTPQNMMVVVHEVADFNKWMMGYEAHDTARVANGIHNYVIGRNMEDTNKVLLAMKVDDLLKAKAFAANPALGDVMKKAGVKGKPTISYTTMVWQDTAMISADLRSRTTFTVKDFDAWRTSFESHRQTRIDNGLADRAYGHDADDPKKVTLVVAVLDTAKARAFWNSDLLKQQRAEGGVTSQPERFIYRVVKRY